MWVLPNWKDLLKKAWSVWAMILFLVISLAREVLSYVDQWLPSWLPPLIVVAAFILRFIPQRGLSLPEKDKEETEWDV